LHAFASDCAEFASPARGLQVARCCVREFSFWRNAGLQS
jgi:hypothetical protein